VAVRAVGAKASGAGGGLPAAFELVHEIFGEAFSSGTLSFASMPAGDDPRGRRALRHPVGPTTA